MIGFNKYARQALAALMAAGLLWLSGGAAAAPFTSGNVVVYRTGGSLNPATAAGSALATLGNPVFLDEYTPTGGYVQSFAMPILASGPNQPLFGGNGNANNAQEGLLQRSANKYCLAVPGYANSGNTNTRTIARVSGAGTINTTTATTDVGVTSIFKGVATNDCNEFWTTSVSEGVRYVASLGATASSTIAATPTAMRALDIYGGRLYASTNTSPNTGMNSFTAALPTATDSPALLNGFSGTNATQPYAFFFAKLGGSADPYDTLYLADSGKGIFKFALVGTTWTQLGSPIFTTGDAYRGLAGTVSGTTVTLFATKGGSSTSAAGGGVLVKVIDTTGYNAPFSSPTLTTLATFATNTTFRGVALAPESPQVTASISGVANGTISPSGTNAADFGAGSVFTVTPASGYAASMSGTCGGNLVGVTYTTNPVTANCTVIAAFVAAAHTVTSSAVGNGTISPPSQSVQDGATTQFTVTPNTGHHATMGGTCPAGSLVDTTYTTGAITADCDVSATFSINQYNVTSSAGANGSIDPETTQTVNYGSQPAFTVTANPGYYATVSGSCGGSLVSITATTYTFTANAVTSVCTVVANFALLPVVTSIATGHGQISPSGSQAVSANSTLQFTLTPESGYTGIASGCGGKMNAGTNTFTTAPVTANCTVTASFATKNILFVGNSYTFARVDPALTYNAANVNDLTADFNAQFPNGTNSWPWNGATCTGVPFSDGCFEPHPWGGVPGIFKALTVQAGFDYNVSFSTRNAATLRGHFLNTSNAVWDLRSNIASQKWDIVMVQGQSDEPLPANKSKNGNPAAFKTYANQIAKYVHQGNGQTTDLVTTEQAIYAAEGFGTSTNTTPRTIPPNFNLNPAAKVFVMQNWSRPDMVEAHKCTVADYTSNDGAPLVDPTCAGNTNGVNGDNTVFYTAQPTTALNLNDITTDMNSALSSLVTGNSQFSGVIPSGNAFQKAVDAGVVKNSGFYNGSGTYDESGLINLWWLDRTHGSKYGSYVSALVHFARLTGQDPTQFGAGDAVANGLGISATNAATLQQMAKAAVVPGAPTAAAAIADNGQATVSFTAPVNLGGLDITGYSATCGSQSASGTASPIVVTGLTNGASVTCTVVATNSVGDSVPSQASSSVTPQAPQTISFPVVATQTFAPSGTFAVTATASSLLTVSFTSLTPITCSVSGSTVSMLSTGACTIRASQAGNAAFLPAADVDQTIAIQAPAIALSPLTIPAGTVGLAYVTQALSATGGTGPYMFAVTAGTLPAGLTLTAAGSLGGTPTTAATSNFTVTATDSSSVSVGGAFTGTQAYSIVVGKGLPVTAVTANINPTVVGQTVVFTATVTAMGPAVTGTVNFLDGASTLCAAVPLSGTQAQCITDTLPAGARSITAVYSGDSHFLESASVVLTQTVNATGSIVLTVTKAGSGVGTVQGSPPGINCGADCTETYASPTPLSLTATPNGGSIFTGWSGACAGRASCDLAMSSSASVVATFAPAATKLNLDVDGSNAYLAQSDGLIIARYLFGIRGTALVADTLAVGADPALIAQHLDDITPLMDIDGDGRTDALTDGVLIMRYLLGLRGSALINSAVSPGARRTTSGDIQGYLLDITPALP